MLGLKTDDLEKAYVWRATVMMIFEQMVQW